MIPILLTSVEDNNDIFLVNAEKIRFITLAKEGTMDKGCHLYLDGSSDLVLINETLQEVQDKIIAAARLMGSPLSMPAMKMEAVHTYED